MWYQARDVDGAQLNLFLIDLGVYTISIIIDPSRLVLKVFCAQVLDL